MYRGLTIGVTCGDCGTGFSVDVEGTEPEHLPEPGSRPLHKTFAHQCPSCGKTCEGSVMLGQQMVGQG